MTLSLTFQSQTQTPQNQIQNHFPGKQPHKIFRPKMSHGDTVPLHASSQSDIDEIENLINSTVHSSTVLPARPPSPPRASIPISTSPFIQSNLPPPAAPPKTSKPPLPPPTAVPSVVGASSIPISNNGIASSGFGSPLNTLTEPVGTR